jgi:hypothetical protein
MSRAITPEQAELKSAIRAYLGRTPHVLLGDVAHETGIQHTTLYFWVNGRTRNLRTAAHVQALAAWVEENCHE